MALSCGLFLFFALLAGSSLTPAQSTSFAAQPVGSTSGERNVPVIIRSAGTVDSVQFLTLGLSGLDFAAGIGAMTCDAATLNLGDTCSESVTFTPASPGLRVGAIVLLDSSSRVLGTAYLSGTGLAGLAVLLPGNLLPVAGNGDATGPLGDGSAATAASLNHPSSVALDGAGNLYIADRDHHRLRKVAPSTGIISTLAGNGAAAYAGDGLVSTSANVSLDSPWGVAVDGAGNIYIADTGNNAVREIVAATGIISTVAGTGISGGAGDGSAATAATLNQPRGVSVDAGGTLYIADTSNHRIRKVNASGVISTVAGDGTGGYLGDGGPATAAELNSPCAVGFDASGNLYIPDTGNNAVRKVGVDGVISTVAGAGPPGDAGDGGAATAARLFSPSGVALDPAGNLFIADTGNASLRKVSAATGIISTIAKDNVGEYVDVAGGPYAVALDAPLGLTFDGSGNLYLADSLNMKIREIQSNFAALDYTAHPVRQGSQSATHNETIENDGDAPLDLTAIARNANAALDSTATTCSAGAPALSVNADCAIGAIFSPSTAGDPLLGSIDVSADSVNNLLVMELIGDATAVTSTAVMLASNPNPSGFGSTVVFTATVTAGSATGSLTGTVSFFDGPTAIASGVPVGASVVSGSEASATASFTTSALAVGSHSITAMYNNGGDPTHASSTAPALSQVVLEGTSTSLVSTINPSAIGQRVTFTATVLAAGGATVPPDGSVTFTDGSATLSTSTLAANGVAAFTALALASGEHSILATYNGDAPKSISGSISNLLLQDVLTPSSVVVTSNANPSTYGVGVTFTAAVTSSAATAPAGAIELLDGAQQIGAATLTGNAGAFTTASLAAGTHLITADYQGDTSHAPAVSTPLHQLVDPTGTRTVLSATPVSATANPVLTLTAAVQAVEGVAVPSGTVLFVDTVNGVAVSLGSALLNSSGTTTLRPALPAGSHSIVAHYQGSANDQASVSAPLTVLVPLAAFSTALKSSPNPSIVETAVTFTATVTGGGESPAGAVTFLDGGASLGVSALNAAGVATLRCSSLAPGTHVITAAFNPDPDSKPSTSFAVNQVVGKIPTTTSLAASSTTGSSSDATLTATVSDAVGPAPTGTVTFTNGSTTLGSATLNPQGLATLTPSLALGTYRIAAAYGGDALHAPSTAQAISISGDTSAFSFTVSPGSVTVETTHDAVVSVTITSFDSFSDTVGFGCSSLPTGVTCHFSAPSVVLAANGSQTAQLTIATGKPLTGGAAAMASRPPKNVLAASMFFPLAILFGCLFGRSRVHLRFALSFASLLFLAVAAAFLIGCTAFFQATAKPGTYVIQVKGTGANSNLIRSQNLTLNVTK